LNKGSIEKMSSSPNPQAVLQAIAAEKLFAIVRTASAESCLWASAQVLEAGFKGIEVPLTVPDAPEVIHALRQRFPQALVGAGTVLTVEDAQRVAAAGAQFIVSPTWEEPLIEFGKEQSILAIPGAMTPTEIFHAHRRGALAIKVFPAESIGGAEFIKSLKGPFPNIPVIATGGIQLEHVAGYLKAGVVAAGVGGPLIPSALIESKADTELKALAQAYLSARAKNA
jgi:2-dehydro-3-deoxyphosphogluconate aldolase / (4S)-4-hydroxy-2-oxoglutarate aldolase